MKIENNLAVLPSYDTSSDSNKIFYGFIHSV